MSDFRTDSGFLKKPVKTPQGFLRVPAYLTRVGVLHYRREDGTVQRELRHPDEVFAAASLESLTGAPVTDRHPSTLVGLDNVQALSRGYVVDRVRQDAGRYVTGEVIVTDANLIGAIERREIREVSPGYTARVEMQSGEYQGERYDAIQRDITYNHVGLGPRGWGRSGAEVQLHLDAPSWAEVILEALDKQKLSLDELSNLCNVPEFRLDSWLYNFETPSITDLAPVARVLGIENPLGHLSMRKIRIDSIDVEVAEAAEATVLTALKTRDDKIAQLEARNDAAEREAKDLAEKLAAAEDPARLDAAVARRLSVVDKARAVCGAEFKADGKSDLEIMREVATAAGFNLEGRNDAFVEAAFELAKPADKAVDAVKIKTDAAEEKATQLSDLELRAKLAARLNARK